MRGRRVDIAGKQRAQIVRRRKVHKSQFAGLQAIADNLNGLPDLRIEIAERDCPQIRRDEFEAWQFAETIVSAPSLFEASKTFTPIAIDNPVALFVEIWEGEKPHTGVTSLNVIGDALRHLWLYYFQDGGWERLKRCSVCPNWFVDIAKNKSTARCSASCTAKWWSRSRRKEQGHKQSTKRTRK